MFTCVDMMDFIVVTVVLFVKELFSELLSYPVSEPISLPFLNAP